MGSRQCLLRTKIEFTGIRIYVVSYLGITRNLEIHNNIHLATLHSLNPFGFMILNYQQQ